MKEGGRRELNETGRAGVGRLDGVVRRERERGRERERERERLSNPSRNFGSVSSGGQSD